MEGKKTIPEAAVHFSSVGVTETIQDDSKIKIYPNPTTGKLRVTSNELRTSEIEIYDIVGKKLSHFTIHD
jgi:hypothetical protein